MTARLLLCLVLVAVAAGAEEKARPAQARSEKTQSSKAKPKRPVSKKTDSSPEKAKPKVEEEKEKQKEKETGKADPEKNKTPTEDDPGENRPAVPRAVDNPRPGSIGKDQLREYAGLTGARKRIVDEALALAARPAWLKYRFGSAEPEDGGLDCSGSVYYVFQRAGIQPPRTSAAQFTWVKQAGALVEVPAGVTSLSSESFAKLKPGDLLFWSGTYEPRDGREVDVSHVQIFLGHEKSDGLPVMIGASDGRPYRGTKRNGYGVFDFRLPQEGAKAKFLGYGLPPAAAS